MPIAEGVRQESTADKAKILPVASNPFILAPEYGRPLARSAKPP
jgi:hypothetical protein